MGSRAEKEGRGERAAEGRLGAVSLPGGACRFLVWAPRAQRVEVEVLEPAPQRVLMEPQGDGYFAAWLERVPVGSLYGYRLDGGPLLPDPASRFQPFGVHGPSAVVAPEAFPWRTKRPLWVPWDEWVLYELHVGTFTPEGTFDAVIPRLDALRDVGITALQLMPVAQFPGRRNWGYDGVFPFAVQHSYGGPAGLQRLVDACHARSMAVVLDVVYNHVGPEGSVFHHFGPYFTDAYRTPWGAAINFDGPGSDGVRRYMIENALYWIDTFRLDGLRVDAVHAIFDRSARPFLAELTAAVKARARQLGRQVALIAESDLNDPRVVTPAEAGGYGFDAQWNDDFHHALHRAVTGETRGYYRDFPPLRSLAKAMADGYVYTGQRSAFRGRRHGAPPCGVEADAFVVFAQNHDQVGNRAGGERLSRLVDARRLRLAAAVVLLSPFTPMLFMGEEYGETAPFLYFTDHGDPGLAEAVRRGRREEFGWAEGEGYDPQHPDAFAASRLDFFPPAAADQRGVGDDGEGRRGMGDARDPRRLMREYYRALLALRRRLNRAVGRSRRRLEAVANEDAQVLAVRRWGPGGWAQAVTVFHFGSAPFRFVLPAPGASLAISTGSLANSNVGVGAVENGATRPGDAPFALDPQARSHPREHRDDLPDRGDREASWTVFWHDAGHDGRHDATHDAGSGGAAPVRFGQSGEPDPLLFPGEPVTLAPGGVFVALATRGVSGADLAAEET